jgi:hypothetical protein
VGALVAPTGNDYLFLWTADEDRAQEDFWRSWMFARVRDFRQVITTLPVGEIHGAAPHRRSSMPAAIVRQRVFSQHSFVFDLNEPEKPSLLTG